MNPDTGEIREFLDQEEAKKTGFTIPIPDHLVEELRAMSPEDRKARVAELMTSGELPSLADIVKGMKPEDLAELSKATDQVKSETEKLRTVHKGRAVGSSTAQLISTMSALSAIGNKVPVGEKKRGHTQLASPAYGSPHKGSKKSTPASRAKRAKRKAQKTSRRRNR